MVDYCKINLENTINSGQVFLWKRNQNDWYGINGRDVLRINEHGNIKSFSKQKIDYFREKDNLEEILKSISKDKTTKEAVKKYLGLRLLRQDPFQCYISFIVSSNSNIQKIKMCLENICKNFGKKVNFDGNEFFLFPEPKILSFASIQEIKNRNFALHFVFVVNDAPASNPVRIRLKVGKRSICLKADGVRRKVRQQPNRATRI